MVVVVNVAVNVHRLPFLRGHLAAAHAMYSTVCLQSLKLVLKDVSPSVASLYH